jgi:hypothetical protein
VVLHQAPVLRRKRKGEGGWYRGELGGELGGGGGGERKRGWRDGAAEKEKRDRNLFFFLC